VSIEWRRYSLARTPRIGTFEPSLQDAEHVPQVDHAVSTQSTAQLVTAAMHVVVSVKGAPQLPDPTAGFDTARLRLLLALPQVCAQVLHAVQLVVTQSAGQAVFEHVRVSDSTGQLHKLEMMREIFRMSATWPVNANACARTFGRPLLPNEKSLATLKSNQRRNLSWGTSGIETARCVPGSR